MDKQQIKNAYKFQVKKIFQYFLQGLIVLAPIGISIWVIVSLFNMVDSILPNMLHGIFPNWIKKDVDGNIDRIPGLGFLVEVIIVLIVGWLSNLFIINKMVKILDKLLENTPGIKFIYSSVKDFLEAFTGNKKKFDKPVLVNVDGADIWRVGFITRLDATEFDMKEYLIVYVPHSYAISGITYFVPKEKVKPLAKISAADAMKFAVSGGVADVSEHL